MKNLGKVNLLYPLTIILTILLTSLINTTLMEGTTKYVFYTLFVFILISALMYVVVGVLYLCVELAKDMKKPTKKGVSYDKRPIIEQLNEAYGKGNK